MATLSEIENAIKVADKAGRKADVQALAAARAALLTQSAAPAAIDPKTMQPPGVPEFVPPGVKGYDPKTGTVTPQVSQGDAYGLGAADIGGMGFADELAAPIGALISGDPREKVLAEMRGQSKAAQEQHPNSFLTGQIGGGVAQAVAGGVPRMLMGGASLLGKTLAGMGMGGTAAAIHGAGSGEGGLEVPMSDPQSRLGRALVEGGIGAVTGGLLPGIGAAAGQMASAGTGKLLQRNLPAPANIMRILSEYIGDPTEARANIAKAGPSAMLADASAGSRDFLDAAIQKGGKGADIARKAIDDRAIAEGQRVTGALDTALGPAQGIESNVKGIRQSTSTARGAAYDTAYASPIDYAAPDGQAIESIVKTRVPKSAIDEANALMRAEGAKSKQIKANIDADGNVTFETLPDVRQLDYITRGLNEVADQADGAGKLGGTTAKGRAYSNLSKEIRDKLKTLVPDYGTALETAADPIRRVKAVKFGSSLLSKGVTRDEVSEFADGITGPERKAVLEGTRAAIDDAKSNVERALSDPNVDARETIKELKMLSSSAARTKLETIIDDPKAVEALFNDIDQAAKAFELRASTAGNSATARRQNIFKDMDTLTAPGIVGTAGKGEGINATKRLIQTLTGMTPEAERAKQAANWAEAAGLMTQPATGAMMDSVEKFGKNDAIQKMMQERIAQMLIGGVRPGSVLVGSQGQGQLSRR